MFTRLLRWVRRHTVITRPVTQRQQGAVLHTRTGLAVNVILFGGGLQLPKPAPRKAAPPRATPIKDRVLGKQLTPAQVRALPVARDPLADLRALTGERYPTRRAVQAAQERQSSQLVNRLAATMAPRVTQAQTIQAPGGQPIRVKAYTRGDGVQVHAHTRLRVVR